MSELQNDIAFLPKLALTDDGHAPAAPMNVHDTGIERSTLIELTLKIAQVNSQVTTESVADFLHLPRTVADELLEQLRKDALLEVLGQHGMGYRYSISNRGRDMAVRLLESNGYIGPAPVTLEAYKAMLEWQIAQNKAIHPERVEEALKDLVLSDEVKQIAALAVSSGRSLFLSGQPGNGKTSIGRKLHNALGGALWIPHCIAIKNNIIRLYDSHCHEAVENKERKHQLIDRRWVKIKRPFIVAGGEMTLESLDLAYSSSLKFYEAPLHMKANGGTFLIDDFGRQLVAPDALLNRWIIPLEHHIDFLTLHTGQKIEVPFLLRLIIATNLDPTHVTDPAFLRRLGYRIKVQEPSEDMYRDIFQQYAEKNNFQTEPEVIDYILSRYRRMHKEMRACEPRDLIERVRDICMHKSHALQLNKKLIDIAWNGYFGSD